MIKKILVFTVLLSTLLTYAQEDAWVYLKDKENVEAALANPSTILSQQAIDRKELHNITIDERDVPLNENYKSQINAAFGITVLAKSKWMNAVHVRGSESNIRALQSLSFVNNIEFAADNLNDNRTRETEDKFFIENQDVVYNYGSAQNQVEMINTDNLHLADYTGDGIIIAVMDSGFPNVTTMGAFERMRSMGNYMGGYDFHDRTEDVTAYQGGDHGTKVLSTMAGFIEDQYVGTAPDAKYYIFRTEVGATENPVEESYWVEAVERADSLGVHIVNTSLGYTTFDDSSYNYTPSDMDGETAFISRGANIAAEKGILLVTSAGNSGNSVTFNTVGAPADSAGSFSIGAVTPQGNYASFSSRGSSTQPTQKPDVVAQGAPSQVIDRNNNIVSNSGTSFSSPIMAGSLASLWQSMPGATAEEVKEIVRQSSSQADNPDNFLGFGIPDFSVALGQLLSTEDQILQDIKIHPNPATDVINITGNIESSSVHYSIYNVLGKQLFSKVSLSTNNVMNISNLSSGVYLLKLESDTSSKILKFIKR